MGNRIRVKYEDIVNDANLLRAAKNTMRNGIRFKKEGALWKLEQEKHINKLKKMLLNQTYKHGKYFTFTVFDPKKRTILAANLTDRVLHHAVYDVLAPLIDTKFIFHSYACRLNKGQHKAIDQAQKWCRNSKYYIHLDVKKFFASINREKLIAIIKNTITDQRIIQLIEEIIHSSIKHNFYKAHQQLNLFEEPVQSNDFPTENKGIPIGNLTSQLFANWYLNELDQFVKHELKLPKYIRYMDDFVVFSNDKKELIVAEQKIKTFCENELKLAIHPSGGPTPTRKGLSFLGFRIFATHCRVKTASLLRFKNKFQAINTQYDEANEKDVFLYYQRIQAWNAHASKANSFQLRKQIFESHPMSALLWNYNMDYKIYRKENLAYGNCTVASNN
jgi:retron-type reverse transcriptase